MSNKIQIRRGQTATTPTGGLAGEPLFDIQAGRFYIATTASTKQEFANRSIILEKANNLSDLSSISTARTNLDVYSKSEVDAIASGLEWKASAKAVSTTPITLSGEQNVDGVDLTAGMRVLVAGQTNEATNGVYVVGTGSWLRASDCNTDIKLTHMAIFIEDGTNWKDTGWVLTTGLPIVVGTTNLVYTQFTGITSLIPGTAITKTGNTVSFDLTILTEETANANNDYLIIWDTSANVHRKMTRANFLLGFDTDTKQVKVSSTDTTEGYLFDKITAGTGIGKTLGNSGANENVTISLDIAGITTETTVIATDDFVPFQDVSAGAIRKATINDLVADALIDGGTWS